MKKSSQARARFVATFLSAILTLAQSQAATKNWSGGGADNNWNTGGNWGGTAPVNADTLAFGGSTRVNNNNNITGLTVATIGFTNGGGFTLSGNLLTMSAGTLTSSNSGAVNVLSLPINMTGNNASWLITNSEVQIAGPFTNASSASPLALLNGGGTVRITAGGNVQSTRWFTINNGAVIIDGGTANISNDGFRLGPSAGQSATFNLTNGGSYTLTGAASMKLGTTAAAAASIVNISSGTLIIVPTGLGSSPGFQGNISLGEQAGTITTFNQSGGLIWCNPVTYSADNRSLNLQYGVAGSTYNFDGGTLRVRQITNALASAATAIFNFNGGTLMPSQAAPSGTVFMPNVITANVKSGGAIIDSTNIDITIAQNLIAGTPTGGGLTKLGTATLTLSGANTYIGGTTVNNGTLLVSTAGSLSGASAVTVKDGANFGVSVASAGAAVSVSSITAGVTTGSGLNFNFGSIAPSVSTAPLQVTTLTANTTVSVNLSGTALAVGTYPLIQYSSVSGLPNFVLGTTPLGVTATLTTNATTIGVNILSVVKSVLWSGALSSAWDASTFNWKDKGNGLIATNYGQIFGAGDQVTFDDSASTTNVDVTFPVTPITMTLATVVNSNYTFLSSSGSGSIGGPTALAITNGTVTMQLSNTYSGGTTVSAGKIRVGNNKALGNGLLTLSGGAISSDSTTARTITNATKITSAATFGNATDNGLITISNNVDFGGGSRTLTFNSDATFAGGANNGTITSKQGTGTLTVKGTVTYTGSEDAQNGTLIYNGATVISSDRLVVDALAGVAARLVITNGSSVSVANSVGNLRSGRGTGGATATNYIDLAGLYSIPNADAADGFVTLRGDAGYSEIAFLPGGDFTARGVTNWIGVGNTVFRFNGGILRARNNNVNFFEGIFQALVQAGGANIDDGGFAITVNQALLTDGVGTGSLTKIGAGTLTLAAANTYSGNTIISNGVLALGASGSISGSASIVLAGVGATFDVSATTFTLGASQTLSNSTSTAVLNGSASTGTGTVSLTYGAGTPALTVTNGTLTLSASTTFKINNTGSALAAGSYKIIAKSTAGNVGAVAGTLPAVTVGGGGIVSGGQAWLRLAGAELYLLVDRPPAIANTVTNNVTTGLNWKVAITNLQTIAGWSDPDGDTVTLSGVSATSFNGTNVSNDADYIYFSGPVLVEDHFSYTVTDGNLTATGTVYLEPIAATAPTISNPSVDGSGHPMFNGAGIPGYTYGVESATSLTGPWINAGTVTAAGDGAWNFTDAGQTNPPLIFYRLYYPYSAGSPPQ